MSQRNSTVFVVDYHPLVRKGTAALLAETSGVEVCGDAETVREAKEIIPRLNPDVVIVDIVLPDASGLDLIKSLKDMGVGSAIVTLSMHEDTLHAERAIRAGACAYVTKSECPSNIVSAVEHALEGKLYMNSSLMKQFAERFITGKPMVGNTLQTLSNRELEVFSMLGRGMKVKKIAVELGLSAKTVHEYCARIKEKLGLSDAMELLREAIYWHEHRRNATS